MGLMGKSKPTQNVSSAEFIFELSMLLRNFRFHLFLGKDDFSTTQRIKQAF